MHMCLTIMLGPVHSVQFGAAMGEQNFERAVRVLEPLELTPETEAQWMELSEQALQNNQVGTHYLNRLGHRTQVWRIWLRERVCHTGWQSWLTLKSAANKQVFPSSSADSWQDP